MTWKVGSRIRDKSFRIHTTAPSAVQAQLLKENQQKLHSSFLCRIRCLLDIVLELCQIYIFFRNMSILEETDTHRHMDDCQNQKRQTHTDTWTTVKIRRDRHTQTHGRLKTNLVQIMNSRGERGGGDEGNLENNNNAITLNSTLYKNKYT